MIHPSVKQGEITTWENTVGMVPYTANQKEFLNIRMKPELIKGFRLHLQITGKTNLSAEGITNMDMPAALMQYIIVSNPKGDTLKQVTGQTMTLMNRLEFKTPEHNTLPGDIPMNTDFTADADVYIPFENHTGKNVNFAERTILNSNEFTELFLTIIWANGLNDLFDTVCQEFAMTCEVIAYSRNPIKFFGTPEPGLPVPEFDPTDMFTPRQKMIDIVTRYMIESSEVEILLPQNTLVKTIMAVGLSPADKIRATLFNDFKVSFDDEAVILRNQSFIENQSWMKTYYESEVYNIDGVSVFEFDLDHDYTELFRTVGRNWPKLVMSADTFIAGTVVDVFVRQISNTAVAKI
ncbi:MAG: hypothetical protein KAV87_51565 [Desulfobacteraceae bacterium]|nr:hypothetical protein [Desulfobacteraceae bacterium]